MTREEAKKLLPIIHAFADGKNWSETERPIWDNYYAYRIKPEPKYRPFKSKEECWQEMLKHEPFGWVKYKSNGNNILIGNVYTDIYTDKEVAIAFSNMSKFYSASEVFNNYTFADGMPFGIKEE